MQYRVTILVSKLAFLACFALCLWQAIATGILFWAALGVVSGLGYFATMLATCND